MSNTQSKQQTTKRVTAWRDATVEEAAAYRAAVAPFVAAHDTKAIIDLRCKMHIMWTSKGLKVRARMTRVVN